MSRVLDFRLTLFAFTLFLRLLCEYPRRFYWIDLALNSGAGPAEVCLYSQDGGTVLALYFYRWSKRCWISRHNSSKVSTRPGYAFARFTSLSGEE